MSATLTEYRSTLRLALPIIAIQLGMMAMGTVDVMMVGHYSKTALAAVGLGHVCIWGAMVFGYGTLNALDPIIAQAVGAKDEVAIRRGVQRGMVLAVLLAIPMSLLAFVARPLLELLDQPAEVIPVAVDYVHWSIPGIGPFFLFCAQRLCLQAFSQLVPLLWTILFANLVNVVANWLLIEGHWGFPELGAQGTAIASSLSRWALAIGLLIASRKTLGPYLIPFERRCLAPGKLLRIFWIGLPMGLQFVLEMGAFAFTLLLMGWIGEDEIAGHQVAINLAAISFMVPVGISAAAAVRVAYGVGQEDLAAMRRSARVAMTLGGTVMIGFGVLFLTAPSSLVALYSDAPEVTAIANTLIPVAGVFQVFDGIQVVAIGILRGLADTRTPFVANLLGFWCLGIPIGHHLAFSREMGPAGLWWGLVIGLGVVAAVLCWRTSRKLQHQVLRIRID